MISTIKQSGAASLVLLLLLLFATLAATTPLPTPQSPLAVQQPGEVSDIDLSPPPATVAAVDDRPIQQPTADNGNTKLEQDTGQVTITKPTGDNGTTTLPIRATIFHGVAGPKACRGRAMGAIDLPGPGPALAVKGEQCFDLAQTANCGVFMSNKADGCEARLFSEHGCREEDFSNLVVFMPENRPVGGVWRSMGIRCGVPEPDPATLGEPPLAQFMKQIPKKPKGGQGPGAIPIQPTV